MVAKNCGCGKTRGNYTDHLNAVYEGPAIPLGFHNFTFIESLRQWVGGEDENVVFDAFTIPRDCKTFVKQDEPGACASEKGA
jgi:hypothetical protein